MSNHLVYAEGGYFLWQSHINDLKDFVQNSLNLEGKWSSPGGDVKIFDDKKYRLKWFGEDKQKLLIVREDKQQNLNERMQILSAKSVNINPTSGIENNSEETNMAELHEVHDNSNLRTCLEKLL